VEAWDDDRRLRSDSDEMLTRRQVCGGLSSVSRRLWPLSARSPNVPLDERPRASSRNGRREMALSSLRRREEIHLAAGGDRNDLGRVCKIVDAGE
jgi:hypothetical protein